MPPVSTRKGVKRLRRDEASRYLAETYNLKYSIATLAKLASVGGGPEIEYAGRFPTHTEAALDAFAESKLSPPVRSTSERKALLAA